MASGLDKLSGASQIKIDQRVEWIEAIPCCEQSNEYQIYNTDETFKDQGEEIGKITEENPGAACLYCCKMMRKYNTNLEINNFQVATSKREFKCACPYICNCLTFLEFCQQECDVFQKGEKIGSIRWPYACFCNPNRGKMSCAELDILNANGDIIYKITAHATQLPFIVQTFCCFSMGCIDSLSRKEYSILDTNGDSVGSITNIYNDLLVECCSKADQFAVKFPSDADANSKLLLLKAAIFLDFIHYGA
ncbi:hypothetical protein PPERSA_08039 [Pseudocohnilembus persalinus]|uniref:Phospholipid scramblase n=1 Tax=Pseudocohnilembus persalinus TaxID=266149 RepID=A0A0V0R3D8_PSEPJ|nr:hypothetical protein PPERSA_08039 [Pseudocohnilembus persalinus]|eukprot:KRX08728.1 hypothetical protein PPERSA_08039 [Pseudocohnilembus persalinus]